MRYFFIALLVLTTFAPLFSEPIEPRITGFAAVPFIDVPEASDVIDALAGERSDIFYGIGWELIVGQIGIGGNYGVNFLRDNYSEWTIEWYAEAIFVSFHLFGAGSFVDPFAQAGLGCAGSVYIGDGSFYATSHDMSELMASDFLTIGIFPYVSIGCAFNLSGLLIGAKLNYVPFVSPPPVTAFDEYPLKKLQAVVFIGISLGTFGDDDPDDDDCDCD